MIQLKDIKMKPKLISLFLIVGLLPMVIAAWWGSHLATKSLMEKSYGQLEAVREINKKQIEAYFTTMEGQLHVIKDNPFIHEKLAEFDEAFMKAGDSIDSDVWRKLAKKWDPTFKEIT